MARDFFAFLRGGASPETSGTAKAPRRTPRAQRAAPTPTPGPAALLTGASAQVPLDSRRPTEETPVLVGALSASACFASPRLEADDDSGWRKISAGAGGDMVGTTVDVQNRWSILNVTRKVLRKNAFLLRDYLVPVTACVVGSGIKLRAGDPKLQKVLDAFVKKNAFHAKFQSFLHNLYMVEGELVLPIKASIKGDLIFTYVYTDTVLVKFSDDDNRLVDYLALMRQTDAQGGDADVANQRRFGAVLDITDKEAALRGQLNRPAVAPDRPGVEVPDSATALRDLAVYVKTNDSTTRRGLPPLYSLLDYADLLDQFVYERMRLLEAVMRIWLDVKVEGANDEKLKELAQKVYGHIPASGSCDLHNEKVTTETRSFQLDGAAIGNDWATFVHGWDLATLFPSAVLRGEKPIEAGSMLYKVIQSMQYDFEEPIRILADCAIAAAKIGGVLAEDVEEAYEIVFPAISAADMGKIATAINQIALALLVGTQEQWIEPKDAALGFVEALEMGLDTEMKALRPKFKPMAPTGAEGGIRPQGGAQQGGQAEKPQAAYTRRGQQINDSTKSKVTRA